jgi:hypothetical protein
MTADVEQSSIASRARASWLCPIIAWASQILFAMALRGVAGLSVLWLLAAIAQLVLIVAGLYFGVKVLAMGRAVVDSEIRLQAIVGTVLSGATILLIAGLFIFNPS